MKNQEEIDDSSSDIKEISEQGKRYAIIGIILLSFLIIVLVVLIANEQ